MENSDRSISESLQFGVLRDYSAGHIGTRDAIKALDLNDFADLLIALGKFDLPLPRWSDIPALRPHREAARALLMPHLLRHGR